MIFIRPLTIQKGNGFSPLSLSNGHLSTNEFLNKQNVTLTDKSSKENFNLDIFTLISMLLNVKYPDRFEV